MEGGRCWEIIAVKVAIYHSGSLGWLGIKIKLISGERNEIKVGKGPVKNASLTVIPKKNLGEDNLKML